MCKNLTFLQSNQADVFKCGGIISSLGLSAGGDDPNIGICVQHGYLIAQISADGSTSSHLDKSIQEEEILRVSINRDSLKFLLNRIKSLMRNRVQRGVIFPNLTNIPCDEIGFPQCAVVPVADTVWATVEFDEEWNRSVPHIAPRAAIRHKELLLHQMLEEGCFPNATIANYGDIRVGLCAEIRQWCNGSALR